MSVELPLTKSDTLLFIGDSITDCGRRDDPERLGTGYVRFIHHLLTAANPADAPNVINRGIGGNTIVDLAHRWSDDVLAIAPTVLSIKIGVNDVWRQLDGKSPGVSVGEYTDLYRELLMQTRDALPEVRLVLCEPTVINSPPQPAGGNELLGSYIAAVRQLADEFHAINVPLFGAFHEACEARPDLEWASDGVHPSPLGHMLLARTWLETTGNLA